MAQENKLPLFASAPLCEILVDGVKVAYAVGLSLNVGVNLQEVRVLGQFEIESIEPLAMMPVTGSFQVIRVLSPESIAENLKNARARNNPLIKDQANKIHGAADINPKTNLPYGSDQYEYTDEPRSSVIADQGQGALTGSAELAKHLDPRRILLSKSFDIEIRLKVPAVYTKVTDEKSNESTISYKNGTAHSFMRVKGCRLTGASANIAPGALLTESAEFQGLLAVRMMGGHELEESNITVPEGATF